MKTNCKTLAGWLTLLFASGSIGTSIPARAALPEPDNVIFGAIAREGLPVTAADFDVVIEVRSALNGPAIARYQMGSNSRLGNLYSIRVTLESIPPTTSPDVTQTGDLVYLVASDANGDFATTNLSVGPRGTFQRMDLGAALYPDIDGDGLPDAWEIAQFNNLNRNGSSLCLNGQTALQNYIAGTNPNDPDSGFKLFIVPGNPQQTVSFLAIRAAGPGYEGKSRFYALESSIDVAGSYIGVTGFTNILGNNQTVSHSSITDTNLFFRGRVSLLGP